VCGCVGGGGGEIGGVLSWAKTPESLATVSQMCDVDSASLYYSGIVPWPT
jgi:hypothetical protein